MIIGHATLASNHVPRMRARSDKALAPSCGATYGG